MQRWLTIAVIVVVAVVSLADPLWCADGCGRRPMMAGHHATGDTPDECVTCQASLSPRFEIPVQPVGGDVEPIADRAELLLPLGDVSPLDHPPRAV